MSARLTMTMNSRWTLGFHTFFATYGLIFLFQTHVSQNPVHSHLQFLPPISNFDPICSGTPTRLEIDVGGFKYAKSNIERYCQKTEKLSTLIEFHQIKPLGFLSLLISCNFYEERLRVHTSIRIQHCRLTLK